MLLFKSLVFASVLFQQAAASCAKDNVLNAMLNSPTPAAAFCATYTKYASAALPTFMPTTYSTSRYSSACTCIATSSTTTTTPIISSISSSTPYCIPTTVTLPPLPASTIYITIITTASASSSTTAIGSTSSSASLSSIISPSVTPTTGTVLTTTASLPSCTATSPLIAGSFEGLSGTYNNPNGIAPWYIVNDSGHITVDMETYEPYDGSVSIFMEHGAGDATWNLTQSVSGICPNTPYKLTFWARTDGEQDTHSANLSVCFGGDCAVVAALDWINYQSWTKFERVYNGGSSSTVQVSISLASSYLFVMIDDVSFNVTSSTSNQISTTSQSSTSSSSTATAIIPTCSSTSPIVASSFEGLTSSNIKPWQLLGGTSPYFGPISHTGSQALLAYHGAGDYAINLTQSVNICPSTPYKLTFWVRTDGEPINEVASMSICFDSDCGFVGNLTQYSTTWTMYERNFAGSVASTVQVSISVSPSYLFIIFDDVNLGIATASPSSSSSSSLPSTTSSTSVSLTSPTTACTAITNPVQNGGFETGALTPWVITHGSSGLAGPIFESGSLSHSGSYSLMVYHGAGDISWNLTQTVTVCPNTAYTLTFWAKTDGEPSAHGADASVCFGNDCAVVGSLDDTSTAWRQLSRLYVGGSDTTIDVAIAMGASYLFILVDDISFNVTTSYQT